MRNVIGLGAILIVAAALAACSPKAADDAPDTAPENAPVAAPVQAPKPKQGKWKLTTAIPGAPAPMAIEVCYTQKMLDDMQNMAGSTPNSDCGAPAISRDGAAVVMRMTCAAAGAERAVVVRTEGDLTSRYTSEITTTSTPPQPGDGQTLKTLAEYVGPC